MPDESNPFQPEPSPPPKSDVRRIAEIMDAHGVEYLVIGGQAETLMGSPRVTYDVDLCYRRHARKSRETRHRFAVAASPASKCTADVPVILDARSLQMGTNFTFHTSIVDLDILGYVEPIGEYDDLNKSAETYRLTDGQLVRTISLDDLLRVKRTIKRFKDSESLFQLTAIKRLRDGA